MVLSFSGGGTRAAAFSYGALEELRRTEIVVDGQRRRLIDEVDMITGVSGGSFTALAYALYGERLFSEYEERFLKRNVQGALLARTLNPLNWWRFVGGSAGRSELAAQYYDEILFEGATFGDLLDKQGPVAIATGTDISTGSRLAFFQELAASAAFGGEVGFGVIRRIVLIVVNARSAPRTGWDRIETPPGFVLQLLRASGVPIDRYSFETVELMKDRAEISKWRRELLVARARLAGETEAQAEASVPKVSLEALDVSFEAIPDPKERAYFMNLSTSFVLPADDVDRLREIAGRLLRQSAEYQSVVRDLGGTPGIPGAQRDGDF